MVHPRGWRAVSEATRLSKIPVGVCSRSAHAPAWNHRIVRTVLIWLEKIADPLFEASLGYLDVLKAQSHP